VGGEETVTETCNQVKQRRRNNEEGRRKTEEASHKKEEKRRRKERGERRKGRSAPLSLFYLLVDLSPQLQVPWVSDDRP
jgi:hypothetical protein